MKMDRTRPAERQNSSGHQKKMTGQATKDLVRNAESQKGDGGCYEWPSGVLWELKFIVAAVAVLTVVAEGSYSHDKLGHFLLWSLFCSSLV